MIKRVRELLHAVPFVPFSIRTSDGREYVIATRDHAGVRVDDSRLYIYLDNGSDVNVSALHVAAVAESVRVKKAASKRT